MSIMMSVSESPQRSITKRCGPSMQRVFEITVLSAGNRTFKIENNRISGQIIRKADKQTTAEICRVGGAAVQRVVEINEEKISNLVKLESIASLQDNWNGNGAKAISRDLIARVKKWIPFLERQPEIFPTACDTLQLEYEREDGGHLEIEVSEDEQAEIFCVKSDGIEEERFVQADVETINKVVREFYG